MVSSFQCPRCGQLLPAATSTAGSAKVVCAGCQASLYVPQFAAVGESDKPKSDTATPAANDDFRVKCEKCGKSIRVPARLAGRNGACPQCKQVFRIPALITPVVIDDDAIESLPASEPPAAETPPAYSSPSHMIPSATPYSASVAPPSPGPVNAPTYLTPTNWQMPTNPIGSTSRPLNEPKNKSQITGVKVCGVLLIILGGINGLLLLLSIFLWIMSFAAYVENAPSQYNFSLIQRQPRYQTPLSVVVVFGAVVAASAAVMIYGGHQMFSLQNWTWSLVASILVVVPCISFTSLLGAPVGIIAIVMLSNPSIRSEFQSIR